MKITYLGHSAFEISGSKYNILIDPFLVMCPDYKPEGITDIFVTHAHGDHLGKQAQKLPLYLNLQITVPLKEL